MNCTLLVCRQARLRTHWGTLHKWNEKWRVQTKCTHALCRFRLAKTKCTHFRIGTLTFFAHSLQLGRNSPYSLHASLNHEADFCSHFMCEENGQRQRSQQRGPKAGPEQSWIKEPNRPLISRSNTHTYRLNQLYRDKYQGRERECVRGLWGVHGDCWGVISCWVMLRDSAVEDGASRYENHDTCEIYLEVTGKLWLDGENVSDVTYHNS